jgi:flagellar basal-body rod modification protein FlgD
MVTAATATTATTDTSAAAAAMKKSVGMNKDDFMKLFIAQLQNQDPLKPQDASALLDQLSQLSLVEQSYNSNTALASLLTAQNNSSSLSAVSFIGKDVKANGNSISFDGSTSANLQFNQAVPTVSNVISISNSAGTVVRTLATGAATGDTAVSWDGRNNSGVVQPQGAYSFTVNGTTATGSAAAATTFITGKIDGINYSSGSPVLAIGSITIPFSDVINVKGV